MTQAGVEVLQPLVGGPDLGELLRVVLRRVLADQLQVATADRLVIAVGRQSQDGVCVDHGGLTTPLRLRLPLPRRTGRTSRTGRRCPRTSARTGSAPPPPESP